ncbi:hypothetical protein PV336_16255 [Streptomyces sp. MI02-2A]|uniref:hypothetical protein n=1 Tax=Streptomyces sp. MI02-2A TaxID=3028688 RepID=UPI0029BE7924|nr:hypothetical protein [Streptomyces sp. MI02-2A]MDX3260774.1 hypothetical protein [Streptomyces sp. MI02-2A]
MQKTLTTAQAKAIRTAAIYTGEVPPSGTATDGRYLVDGRANTLAVLVRLGLVETITETVGIDRETITHHVLTRAGEMIRQDLHTGGALPTLGHVAQAVEYAAARANLDGRYEPNEPGATSLRDARPLTILGRQVSVTIEGKGERAYLYVGGTWLYDGPVPSALLFRHEINAWAARVALGDPAPWAQVGARVGTPFSHGTVTGRRTYVEDGPVRYSIVYRADADGQEYAVTADSPHLRRLCALCDTVGNDDSDPEYPARFSSFGKYLCGFCSHAYSERYVARMIPGRPEDGWAVFDREHIDWFIIRMTEEQATERAAELSERHAARQAHPDDCRYCEAGEGSEHTYEPPTDATPANLGQEEGHSALCGWPYRACVDFCAHLEGWDSHKFSSPLAERLHVLTLDSSQDAELGNTDTIGWFARFDRERAILSVDDRGFVNVVTYDTDAALTAAWEYGEAREAWSYVDALTIGECDALFLIVDTARHIGSAPDLGEIREHIESCKACHDVNAGLLDV